MHRDVLLLGPSSSVFESARRMIAARKGYGVLQREGRLVGIVTEWDVLEKVVARGADPATTPVESIASAPVVSCDANTPTHEVVERMAREGFRRMIVTEGAQVVGAITSKDLIAVFRQYIDKISADISRFQNPLP